MQKFFFKISLVIFCLLATFLVVVLADDLTIWQDTSPDNLQFFEQSSDLQKLSMQELDLSGDLTYQLSYSFMDQGRYEWAFNTILVYDNVAYSEASDYFMLGTFDLKNGTYYNSIAEQYKLNSDIIDISSSIYQQEIRQANKTSKEREALMDELVEYVFTNGDDEDISKFDIIFELNKLEALLVGVENITTSNGVTVFPLPADMEFCNEPICLEVKFGKYPRLIAQEDENTVLASVNIMLEALNKILQKPLEISLVPSHHFVPGNWNLDTFRTLLNSEIKVYTKEYPILNSNEKISLFEAFGKVWNTMISFGEATIAFGEGIYSGFDNAVSIKDKLSSRDKKEADVGADDNYSLVDKVKGYLKDLKLTDKEIEKIFGSSTKADLDKIKDFELTTENKFKTTLEQAEEDIIDENTAWTPSNSNVDSFLAGKIEKTEDLIGPSSNIYFLKKVNEMSNTDSAHRTSQQDNAKGVNKTKAIISGSSLLMEQLLEMGGYFDKFEKSAKKLNLLIRKWQNLEEYTQHVDSILEVSGK